MIAKRWIKPRDTRDGDDGGESLVCFATGEVEEWTFLCVDGHEAQAGKAADCQAVSDQTDPQRTTKKDVTKE